MSNLLRINDLSYAVGGVTLFDDLQLSLDAGDRIGLVGHNGCGKSSLLSILAERAQPEQGSVQKRRGLRMTSVEQFLPEALEQSSLLDAVDAERWRAEATLERLGFAQSEFTQRVGTLSGGQQNRLMFARAIVGEPDVLLLDEPTNHLDLHTTVLFERYLRALKCAFVLVSHDRQFLDTVTEKTWVLRDRRVYHYAMAYSAAREALAHHDQAAAHARAQEERKIDALRASAKRLNMWGKVYDNEKLAKRGQAMDRRADKLEESKTFTTRGSPLSLSLELGATRGREILRVESFDIEISGRTLFNIEELVIRPGERVALLGHNGVGKSTFIRSLVAGQAAAIRLRPQTRLGYYDQELEQVVGPATMAAFVAARADADDEEIRRRLVHAGFAYEQHGQRVSELSGGERARVLFVALSLQSANFLVLDEPTNHIDLEGKEQLEEQLCGGTAAVLLTSHDRRFIENVAERFLWINDGLLIEINDPSEFFSSDLPERGDAAKASIKLPSADTASMDHDAVLERLVELEEKLAADRARKAKHQKPDLQHAWQREIDSLYARLEASGESP